MNYSSLPNQRTSTPYLFWPNFHPVRSYSGLQAYLFFWIFKDFCQIFRPNLEKFQNPLLLWIKLPFFTLHSSNLIKISPCTLIWFLSKFHPVSLLGPVRLFERLEYISHSNWKNAPISKLKSRSFVVLALIYSFLLGLVAEFQTYWLIWQNDKRLLLLNHRQLSSSLKDNRTRSQRNHRNELSIFFFEMQGLKWTDLRMTFFLLSGKESWINIKFPQLSHSLRNACHTSWAEN